MCTLLLQLLRAQKKAVKKEQMAREELERKQLSVVLQVQHLLQGLQQEHVRKDLLAGSNQAPHLPAQKLHSLNQLATLLGAARDPRLRYLCSTTADEPLGLLSGNPLTGSLAYTFGNKQYEIEYVEMQSKQL